MKGTEFIPTEINSSVEKWIAYFQGRGRPHMERYLLRSTRYEALMKKVLRDNKLPEDLIEIAVPIYERMSKLKDDLNKEEPKPEQ